MADQERQVEVFDIEYRVGEVPAGWDGSPWSLIGELELHDEPRRPGLQTDAEAANAAVPHAEPHAEDMDRESFEQYVAATWATGHEWDDDDDEDGPDDWDDEDDPDDDEDDEDELTEEEIGEEIEARAQQRANFDAIADGGWPPFPGEY